MTRIIVAITVVLYLLTPDAHRWGLWPTTSFRWWQPLTYTVVHAYPAHLILNMITLWSFGRALEKLIGGWRMLATYLCCGAAAAGVHVLVQLATGGQTAAVGSSGAVLGVLVTYVTLRPDARLRLAPFGGTVSGLVALAVLLVCDITASIVSSDMIAHSAHLGGALCGVLCARMWKKKRHALRG